MTQLFRDCSWYGAAGVENQVREQPAQIRPQGPPAITAANERLRQDDAGRYPGGQIAAIARLNHLAVATRNVPDFERCGIEVVNPFTANR
jgi:predicted nucleic acid-binding protein